MTDKSSPNIKYYYNISSLIIIINIRNNYQLIYIIILLSIYSDYYRQARNSFTYFSKATTALILYLKLNIQ